jgi:outer membrane protein
MLLKSELVRDYCLFLWPKQNSIHQRENKTMKKLLYLPVLVILLLGTTVSAQQPKLGHINTNELLSIMPGRDSAQVKLENYAQQLEQQFTAMQTELQTKYQDYLTNESTYSELIRQSKQREITSIQERLQEFQEQAQQDLANQENQLLSPIIDAARQAIEDVAKENGYAYVFDTAGGQVLYFPPSDNIMGLVKTKLGIAE